MTTAKRIESLEYLADRFPGDWTPDKDGASFDELAASRYAVVQGHGEWNEGPGRLTERADDGWWISTWDTVAEARTALIACDRPWGIWDLDTKRDLKVT